MPAARDITCHGTSIKAAAVWGGGETASDRLKAEKGLTCQSTERTLLKAPSQDAFRVLWKNQSDKRPLMGSDRKGKREEEASVTLKAIPFLRHWRESLCFVVLLVTPHMNSFAVNHSRLGREACSKCFLQPESSSLAVLRLLAAFIFLIWSSNIQLLRQALMLACCFYRQNTHRLWFTFTVWQLLLWMCRCCCLCYGDWLEASADILSSLICKLRHTGTSARLSMHDSQA